MRLVLMLVVSKEIRLIFQAVSALCPLLLLPMMRCRSSHPGRHSDWWSGLPQPLQDSWLNPNDMSWASFDLLPVFSLFTIVVLKCFYWTIGHRNIEHNLEWNHQVLSHFSRKVWFKFHRRSLPLSHQSLRPTHSMHIRPTIQKIICW